LFCKLTCLLLTANFEDITSFTLILLFTSPTSPASIELLGNFSGEIVGTVDSVVETFRDGRRIQKPQDAAQTSLITLALVGSDEEQYRMILPQYPLKSAHVGSKVGTGVGLSVGCFDGPADGDIDGEAVGLIVLLLQVPQDTGQSSWISFLEWSSSS